MADDMNYELMAERTRYLKESPEGVSIMCKEMEDMRRKAREEGRIEGMDIFAALVCKLTELGRGDDISKAAMDTDYRDKLISEFAIH